MIPRLDRFMSDTQRYCQLGNAVTVPVIAHIFSFLKAHLESTIQGVQNLDGGSSLDTPNHQPENVTKSKKIMTELKYVAYYRVSTQKQKKSGLGLDSQKAIVEHFAKIDKAEIIQEFTESRSGKDMDNRPILKEAINYCLKNDCILIVAKLDRLSRDVEHIFKIKKKLKNRFKSCDLPSSDSLTLSIFAGLAQRERELISIRTKAALKAKKAQGAKLGNPSHLTEDARKLAWQRIRENATNNPNNQRAMRLIVRCRNEKLGWGKIAKELNENGFVSSRGGKFYKSSVKRLYERFLRTQKNKEEVKAPE